MEIATIDVSKIGLGIEKPTFDDFKDVGLKFREAFSKLGFVYITNHGVDNRIIEEAMKASKAFFELDQTIKDKASKTEAIIQGYVKPGQEIFDAKEDWSQVEFRMRKKKY